MNIFFAVLALCCEAFGQGQGVPLSAGESLWIGFDGVSGCVRTDLGPLVGVHIALGRDELDSGESVRLEMFENTSMDPVFASQTFNPTTSASLLAMSAPVHWLDYQGLVRVSMLSGSIDVDSATFYVEPDASTICSVTVAVPEPTTAFLLVVSCAVAALLWSLRSCCTIIHDRAQSPRSLSYERSSAGRGMFSEAMAGESHGHQPTVVPTVTALD